MPNAFVPEEHGGTAEATHARLRTVFAGGFLCFGRRLFGLLPAGPAFPDDDAASVSPLRLADRPGIAADPNPGLSASYRLTGVRIPAARQACRPCCC